MSTLSLVLIAAASAGAQPQGVVLDFSATWCGPCQQMNPIVEKLKRQGYAIRKVDVDKERELAKRFNIQSIPAFVLVVNGKEQNRITGMTSESQLKRMLAQIPTKRANPAPGNPHVHSLAQGGPKRGNAPAERTREVAATPTGSRRRKGINLPFLNRKKQSEPDNEDAVVRAKLGEKDELSTGAVIDGAVVHNRMASSGRIRVKDGSAINFGTGTVIESRTGRTYMLTCAHLFRGISRDAAIEVDLVVNGQEEAFVARLVDVDEDADVGLIAISTAAPVAVSNVALTSQSISVNEPVYSIGCGGGEAPSRQSLKITAVNRYDGPDNIECTGVPMQGRSGGGLFNAAGEVIGVCSAADPKEKRGLYAHLATVHKLLEKNNLAHLHRRGKSPEVRVASNERATAAAGSKKGESHALTQAAGKVASNEADGNNAGDPRSSLTPSQQAAVDKALTHDDEAEVICIIRPKNTKGKSRVVIINRASARFVSYLTGEMEKALPETVSSMKFPVENRPFVAPRKRPETKPLTRPATEDFQPPRPVDRTVSR